MNKTTPYNPDRIDQFMVDAATQGLAPQEAVELRDAMERDPSLQIQADAYALAATAVELALAKPDTHEALPTALRGQLMASARQHAASSQAPAGLKLTDTPASRGTQRARPGFSWTDGRAFGWYAAAAAMIALCVLIIQPRQTRVIEKVVEKEVPPKVAPGPSITQQYADLAKEQSTIRADWAPNPAGDMQRFANAGGEVIWNSAKQTGYMKLTGLPKNDPGKEQYQLWIVDPTRDAEPIDGGVFDVTAAGEVIVPIDAKLRSDSPAVFAITVEKPGGVVVSEGPLQVVAAVAAAG